MIEARGAATHERDPAEAPQPRSSRGLLGSLTVALLGSIGASTVILGEGGDDFLPFGLLVALAVGIGAGGVWSGVVTRRIWVALAGVVAIVTLPTLHFLEGGAPHYYPFIVYDGSTSYYLGALIVTFVAAFISGFGILTPSAGRRIGL